MWRVVMLPPSSRLFLSPDFSICRVLNGLWQVSGAHGKINPKLAIASMLDYFDAGFTTWDLADHYGPAEDFIGEFRRQLRDTRGDAALAQLQAFTKWVPRPGSMTRRIVEQNIEISLGRMGVDCLDMLQFHWWDYSDPRYLEALHHLADLQKVGKIRFLALTNFDTLRLQQIVEAGIPIVSNQVQFSLVDRRPLVSMSNYCQAQGIHLLAYGTLAGGLLSDRYLGVDEPGRWALETASLRKYSMMVNTWGGWALLQTLLQTLKKIADKHQVAIATIAQRYVLEQPAVAGIIVGTRLGIAEHRTETAKVFEIQLDAADYQQLAMVFDQVEDLYQLIGDCGDEYRR
jgi:aryl-alcohol dehydrogenase-like predicted oxidoreductase